jgi:predicted nucleic acid-binding protein
MRCVFDANVIISASLSKYSVPFRAFEFVLDHHTLLLSKETFEELESTLFKTKFNKYFFPEDTRPGVLGTVLIIFCCDITRRKS